MKFIELGEAAIVRLEMAELRTIARACAVAVETGDADPGIEMAAAAFALAACIAHTAGDMPKRELDHMRRIYASINDPDAED